MKLMELLALLEIGQFKVIDRDTELRTEPLQSCFVGDSQLKTLRDKKVKSIRLHNGSLMEIEVAAE